MSINFQEITRFNGYSKAISDREKKTVLRDLVNFDSNLVDGRLVLRNGYASVIDSPTGLLDKLIAYRDNKYSKDIILALDKDPTISSRKLWYYLKSTTDTNYVRQVAAGPPDYSGGLTYGNIEMGDSDFGVTMFTHDNFVRIGTGNGVNNKALLAGYYDRTGDDAMFNNVKSFSGYYISKQQWVQQPDQFGDCAVIIYDDAKNKYYALTSQGLEIRDEDWHIERVIRDVVSWTDSFGVVCGGMDLNGSDLYVVGKTAGATANDTRIVRYDTANGYKQLGASSVTASMNRLWMDCATDGSQVWIVEYVDSAGTEAVKVYELPVDLSSTTLRATQSSSGAKPGYSITAEASGSGSKVWFTYHLGSGGVNQVISMLKASPYTLAPFSPTVLNNTVVVHLLLEKDTTTLYYVTRAASSPTSCSLYSASVLSPNSTTIRKVVSDFICNQISITAPTSPYGVSMLFSDSLKNAPFITNGSFFTTLVKMLPGKLHIKASNTGIATDSYYYAASIVDIFGQEHHLMSPVKINSDGNADIEIYLNPESEQFEEQSASFSNNILALNSVWNEFRRIKKIKVYRTKGTGLDVEPDNRYRFLKEIDINDADWVEVTANELYKFSFHDDVSETEISDVSYEESTGLPETFKPFYLNWKYSNFHENKFYYGNWRYEELFENGLLETRPLWPDVCYANSLNSTLFRDGREQRITGIIPSFQRLLVFKENITGMYNDLQLTSLFPIGCTAPNSIISVNNIVFFGNEYGIFAMDTANQRKMSFDIDEDYHAETDISDMSAFFDEKKFKIYFHVPAISANANTYCFNINKRTWDKYRLNHLNLPGDGVQVRFFAYDANRRIIFTENFAGEILAFNSGYSDKGFSINGIVETEKFTFGRESRNAAIQKLVSTYMKADTTFALVLNLLDEAGSSSQSVTFPINTVMSPVDKYIVEKYANQCYLKLDLQLTGDMQIEGFLVGYDFVMEG